MPAYAVRVIKTREFVGLLCCEFDEEISDLIDELCDPGACEAAELPSGMIFAGPNAPMIPVEAANDQSLFGALSLAGSWVEAFGTDGNLEWATMQEIYDKIGKEEQ